MELFGKIDKIFHKAMVFCFFLVLFVGIFGTIYLSITNGRGKFQEVEAKVISCEYTDFSKQYNINGCQLVYEYEVNGVKHRYKEESDIYYLEDSELEKLIGKTKTIKYHQEYTNVASDENIEYPAIPITEKDIKKTAILFTIIYIILWTIVCGIKKLIKILKINDEKINLFINFVGISFFAFSFLIVSTAHFVFSYNNLKNCSEKTVAVAVGGRYGSESHGGHGSYDTRDISYTEHGYRLLYQYEVNGEKYYDIFNPSLDCKSEGCIYNNLGDTVTLKYNPKSPQQNIIGVGKNTKTGMAIDLLFMVGSSSFLILMCVSIFNMFKKKKDL